MNLYTIGYSRFPLPEFIEAMGKWKIPLIVDVRSVPFSARYRAFNRDRLESSLSAAGLSCQWLGDRLGGLKGDAYAPISTVEELNAKLAEDSFISGCRLLRDKLAEAPVCLLCAENDPLDCHRAILVSHLFRKFDDSVSISHIWKPRSAGTTIIESQAELDERCLEEVYGGKGERNLDSAYASLNASFARKRR